MSEIDAATVQRFRCFEGISAADAAAAAQCFKPVRLTAGEALFRQGDKGDAVYLLVEGTVDVQADAPGEEDHRLATLDSGAVLGEVSLLVDEPRSATVIAKTDARLWCLTRADFEAAVERGDHWANRFLLVASRDLARRLSLVNRQLVSLISDTKKEETKPAAAKPAAAKVAELESLRLRLFSEWSF